MNSGCPKCRFKGANILPDGSLRCAGCSYIYRPPIAYPEPPNRVGTSAAPVAGGSRNVVVLVAVVGVLIFGAVFAYAAMGQESDAPSEKYHSEPSTLAHAEVPVRPAEPATIVPETPAVDPKAYAIIDPNVVSGFNGTKRWWLLQYFNTGDVPISFPSIKCELHDASGEPFEYIARSNVYWLPTGEYAWILAMPTTDTSGDASFTVDGPKSAARQQVAWKRLEPSQIEIEPHPNTYMSKFPYLTGRVANNSGSKLGSIRLQGIGYDEEDKVCAYATGYAKPTTLEAGGTSDFKFGTGTWQVRPPVRWEVESWGVVQK